MQFSQFFLDTWYLFLAAAVSGGLLLWPLVKGGASASGAGRVDTAEAVRLINREKAVLIDVREPDEFAAGHAPQARNVPVGKLGGESVKGLPSNKALPVLLMCATGGRAAKAAETLRKAGHANVQVVAGGLAAWRSAQLPVERSATASPA